MISLEDFKVTSGDDLISFQENYTIPCNKRFLLFSRRRSLASLLISAIAGSIEFDGVINRSAKVSFPFGHSQFFQEELDVRTNIEVASEVFEVDPQEVFSRICAFPGISHLMNRTMLALPRFAQVKVSYALGYSIRSDCLIIDGPPMVGDEAFRSACRDAIEAHSGGYIAVIDKPSSAASAFGECGALLNENSVEIHDKFSSLQKSIARI